VTPRVAEGWQPGQQSSRHVVIEPAHRALIDVAHRVAADLIIVVGRTPGSTRFIVRIDRDVRRE